LRLEIVVVAAPCTLVGSPFGTLAAVPAVRPVAAAEMSA
jgi:hypothetical protein